MSIFREIKDFVRFNKSLYGLFLLFVYTLVISLNPIHIYFKALFSILVIFFLLSKSKVDSLGRLLFMFSLTYGLITIINGLSFSSGETVCYFVAPLAFYLFGQNVVKSCQGEQQLIILILLCVLALGANVYWSTIIGIIDNGFVNVGRMLAVSGYGSEEETMNATLLGAAVSFGFAGFATFIFNIKHPFTIISLLGFAIGCLSILTVVYLVNRTGLFVAFSVVIITYYWMSKSDTSNLVWIGLGLLAIYVVVVKTGIVDESIIDAYINRSDTVGNSLEGNSRFDRWSFALQHVFIDPFGWASNSSYQTVYAHNLWLDVARYAGILPFAFLIIATVKAMKQVVCIFKKNNSELAALFIGLNICLFLTCMVEPIMEGSSITFYFSCFIWGCQCQYLMSTSSSNV